MITSYHRPNTNIYQMQITVKCSSTVIRTACLNLLTTLLKENRKVVQEQNEMLQFRYPSNNQDYRHYWVTSDGCQGSEDVRFLSRPGARADKWSHPRDTRNTRRIRKFRECSIFLFLSLCENNLIPGCWEKCFVERARGLQRTEALLPSDIF